MVVRLFFNAEYFELTQQKLPELQKLKAIFSLKIQNY